MTVEHAQVWAGALGWGFRNYSASGVFTDEEARNRIDVWADRAGLVVKVKKY